MEKDKKSPPKYWTRQQKKKKCHLLKIPSNTSLTELMELEEDYKKLTKSPKLKKKKRYIKLEHIEDYDSDVDSYGNIKDLIDYDYDEEEDSDYIQEDSDDSEDLEYCDISSLNKKKFKEKMLKKLTFEKLKNPNKIVLRTAPDRIRYNSAEQLYLETIKEDKRKEIFKIEEELKKFSSEVIPMRFKVLTSKMDLSIKSILLEKLELIKNGGQNGEFYKLKAWVDNVLKIPFKRYSGLGISLSDGRDKIKEYLFNSLNILNNSVYGHKQGKLHMLQLITRWITNPISRGSVIGIQGPMGNGKTTLVKYGISSAIKKPFIFIPLGGATDSCFLEGHSFTYEGSIPGIIAQSISEKRVNCMDPIFYFDELDKVSETAKGEEIYNVLCHLTDFTQNDQFYDKYYSGIPIDLSKSLFIFSFNDESKINPILKDRMTIIRTTGFSPKEKITIANKYLLPNITEMIGIKEKIHFSDDILRYIITNFTEEEGVRSLKRCIEEILSKLNLLTMLGEPIDMVNKLIPFTHKIEYPLTITTSIVEQLLKDIKKKESMSLSMYL